jgi:hypothetical protein
MGGGLMQLVAYGAQDVYLSGNPQITFFKVVYRRHTNFACESVQQTFNGNADVGKSFSATISRNGDLIHKMWLRVVIPSISVTQTTATNIDSATSTIHFARKMGLALIKNVELEIGGQTIDKQYGDWMNIWNELSLPKSKQSGYSKLIGDGELAKNDIGAANPRYNQFTYGGFTSKEVMGTGGTAGTIPEQEINIPLEFWFCRNPGLALPLIALQYHEVRVNFEMNVGRNLGMISLEALDNGTGAGVSLYTWNAGSNTQSITVTTSGNNDKLYKRKLFDDSFISLSSCTLWVDYIYLDTDERRRFAQTSHEYLIEQLQYAGQQEFEASNVTAKLHFNHPVKEIVWVAQPGNNLTETEYTSTTYSGAVASTGPITNNVELQSSHNVDFTGWYIVYIDSGVAQPAKLITAFDTATHIATVGTSFGVNADPLNDTYIVYPPNQRLAITNLSHGQFDYQFYPTLSDSTQDTSHIARRVEGETVYPINPVVDAKIMLNGHDRTVERSGDYYNLIQPTQHHTRIPHDRGINVYSFALKPEEHQPSGTCNFSRIDVADLKMTLRTSDIYKLRIYATNYNVLRIMSGMGGLAFAN